MSLGPAPAYPEDWVAPCGPGWALGNGLGVAASYLVLAELIHGLCDTVTVVHPHHPGKPGDKASIT